MAGLYSHSGGDGGRCPAPVPDASESFATSEMQRESSNSTTSAQCVALLGRQPPPREHHLQRVAVNAEDTRRLTLVPMDTFKDPQHDLPLEFIARLLQRKGLTFLRLRAVIG